MPSPNCWNSWGCAQEGRARITALVVAERARRRGGGTRLVAATESFAADRGCVRREVTSADRGHDAPGFCRRRGYADRVGRCTRFLWELPA
jgi:GNAT superfamily N-acetyltransferase